MQSIQQRMDITEVVGAYKGKSPRQARDDSVRASRRPTKKKPTKARTAARPEPWYVVVEDIFEDLVTVEAWPWPTVNPDTHFLAFDLSRSQRMTREASLLHSVISKYRLASANKALAERPLRIGDVFKVQARKLIDTESWTSVVDHTQEKRVEANAALQAMAAPPHPPKEAEALEKLARSTDAVVDPAGAASAASKAFAAV